MGLFSTVPPGHPMFESAGGEPNPKSEYDKVLESIGLKPGASWEEVREALATLKQKEEEQSGTVIGDQNRRMKPEDNN